MPGVASELRYGHHEQRSDLSDPSSSRPPQDPVRHPRRNRTPTAIRSITTPMTATVNRKRDIALDYIPLAQDELVRWPQGTTYQALISTPSRVTDDFELTDEARFWFVTATVLMLCGDVPCAVETQRQLGSRLRNHL